MAPGHSIDNVRLCKIVLIRVFRVFVLQLRKDYPVRMRHTQIYIYIYILVTSVLGFKARMDILRVCFLACV